MRLFVARHAVPVVDAWFLGTVWRTWHANGQRESLTLALLSMGAPQ